MQDGYSSGDIPARWHGRTGSTVRGTLAWMQGIPAAWRRLDRWGLRHPVVVAGTATLMLWLGLWALLGTTGLFPLLAFVPLLCGNLARSSSREFGQHDGAFENRQ